MKDHGKKYEAAAKMIEPGHSYPPDEAVELAKKVSYTNFPGTVELHLRTGSGSRVTPTRSFVGLPCCRTAWASRFACWSSPRAKASGSPRKPARTTSAPMI